MQGAADCLAERGLFAGLALNRLQCCVKLGHCTYLWYDRKDQLKLAGVLSTGWLFLRGSWRFKGSLDKISPAGSDMACAQALKTL